MKLPSWIDPLTWKPGEPLDDAKYLLAFDAFAHLPDAVQQRYLAGKLHLLPCPGSLVFWHMPAFHRLATTLPFALQTPLLDEIARREDPRGVRVPQAGWLHTHDEHKGKVGGPIRNGYRRTHRWARVLRDQDELSLLEHEEKLLLVLFSTIPDDLGLYGKPMARNVQLWSKDYELILNGPRASEKEITKAYRRVEAGGAFGYRFVFPAMRIGRHEAYWHRPLAAFLGKNGKARLVPNAPLGIIAAYDSARPKLDRPVVLYPRILEREPHLAALRLFQKEADHQPLEIVRNIRKLLDAHRQIGEKPLPTAAAQQLLTRAAQSPIEEWLEKLPERAADRSYGKKLADHLRSLLAPSAVPEPLTYRRTATRRFEIAYWKTIAALAEGKFLNKNNADCINDLATRKAVTYRARHLDSAGEYLLDYYRKLAKRMRATKRLTLATLPFSWDTDFDFSWFGGWQRNREQGPSAATSLRSFGRDRRRSGDHGGSLRYRL